MKTAEIVSVFDFVLSEVRRFNEMVRAGRSKEAFAECGIGGMLRVKGGGSYLCGRAAERKLAEIAHARIDSDSELKERIWLSTYLEPLESEVARRFIENREANGEGIAKDILKAAKIAALQKLETRRYYFPVFCIDEENLDEFSIGAVRFERTKSFFERERAAWDASKSVGMSDELPPRSPEEAASRERWIAEFFAHSEKELSRYWWIASVEIAGAEPRVGWEKAQSVIDLTSSVLRLFLRTRENSFIGPANQSPKALSEVRFSKKATGVFQPSASSSMVNMPVVPGFVRDMKNVRGFAQIEWAVEHAAKWDELPVAEHRLIVALGWFGEAWKDRHPQAQLVKFATCLESLLMTGGREGITELLAERFALLVECGFAARQQCYDDAREVYAARSKAVHGDVISKTKSLSELNHKAEELAIRALLEFAQMCPVIPPSCDLNKVLGDFFTAYKLGGFEAASAVVRAARKKDGTTAIPVA